MSELPSFKEGFIFDATDNFTNDKDNPFVIYEEGKPCLFKIASLNDYSKNYSLWNLKFFEDEIIVFDENIKAQSYNDLSFISTKERLIQEGAIAQEIEFKEARQLIIWNDGIYFYYCTRDYTKTSTVEIILTRLDDITQESTEDFEHFYFKHEFSAYHPKFPTVSYFDYNNMSFGANGYEMIINNPVTIICWSYDVYNTGDYLKYYQFSLYNSQNKCIVDTGKLYPTGIFSDDGFVCNSLDDESEYTLIGYCVSQSGRRIDLPDLIIKTKYTTGKIYANLTIELDKHLAENKISEKFTNIIGEAKDENNVTFIDSEKLDLKNNDNNILFRYNLPTNNFLIRLWINGIKESNEKITILKLSNNDDYIELYYENGYFYAIKHSCGLTSRYMSNSISNILNANTYLSLLYYNGRIDIYASNY